MQEPTIKRNIQFKCNAKTVLILRSIVLKLRLVCAQFVVSSSVVLISAQIALPSAIWVKLWVKFELYFSLNYDFQTYCVPGLGFALV